MSDEEIRRQLRQFVAEQSEGEWDDKMIDADTDKLVAIVKNLIGTLAPPKTVRAG